MGIFLAEIRIRNYRSLEYVEVELGMTNILIGQNNSGKSNFLRAINIALGGSR
ncbi:MAG: ATP-binding protein, partial [Spirochaetia bacterium]|nr:ATP-binding protein [Spirochaetia bacterium]